MDVLARIRDLAVKELSIDAARLDPDTPLASLNVDSLAFMEFLYKIEDEFGVSLPDEHVKDVKTLAELERCVAAALATAGKV
jgi:acyl carrier protein